MPIPGIAPARRRRSETVGECVLRPSIDADGRVVVEELPLTLDLLLNPREGDQVTQSNEHERHLEPLIDRLRRFLERRRGWGVFSDLLIHWGKGLRKNSPDVAVIEGIGNPKAARGSLDLAKEGGRVRAVFEVVSTSTASQREKDEEHNLAYYARRGVEDYVLFYPPERRGSEDPALRVYSLAGGVYEEQEANAQGRFLMRTLGLWLSVGEDGEPILEVVATGERLLRSDEEEAGRREAERRVAEEAAARQEAERQVAEEATARQEAERRAADEAAARQAALAKTLLMVVENRGLPLSDDARQHILDCHDSSRLERWIEHVFKVDTLDDLWKVA